MIDSSSSGAEGNCSALIMALSDISSVIVLMNSVRVDEAIPIRYVFGIDWTHMPFEEGPGYI